MLKKTGFVSGPRCCFAHFLNLCIMVKVLGSFELGSLEFLRQGFRLMDQFNLDLMIEYLCQGVQPKPNYEPTQW